MRLLPSGTLTASGTRWVMPCSSCAATSTGAAADAVAPPLTSAIAPTASATVIFFMNFPPCFPYVLPTFFPPRRTGGHPPQTRAPAGGGSGKVADHSNGLSGGDLFLLVWSLGLFGVRIRCVVPQGKQPSDNQRNEYAREGVPERGQGDECLDVRAEMEVNSRGRLVELHEKDDERHPDHRAGERDDRVDLTRALDHQPEEERAEQRAVGVADDAEALLD